ncbi:isoprenylcysteine carboxylmethyltransferase family protein [Actibacterium sp. 188UL27-1]|uniref:methyltransferase family protein n=1 Tax=Actibacterium sp. 188UL27-1 TaxID=2786961 RepID=UPI001EF501F5|nr:isoprenylcysteine carboxylmethyltransferase family protein [Actibacterium sp. 188UL27-1]
MLKLIDLVMGLRRSPPGAARITTAVLYGIVCHVAFFLAVTAMICAMFWGMSESLGRVAAPWSVLANLALVIQFPLTHSLLLSRRGGQILAKMAPRAFGPTLATTTYAIIASLQLFALFVFWTPSGIIWWQAEGSVFIVLCGLYGLSWVLLAWSSYDAGAEVQSGALGWMSLAQNIKPVFPDMPTTGLFRIIRQPIYVSFALTTWTVPAWTPDQFCLAIALTAYCLMAPRLKERRFAKRYGSRFEAYRHDVPYAFPRIRSPNG